MDMLYNHYMLDRFRRLFAAPIFPDEEKTRNSKIINAFGWVVIFVLLVLYISRWVSGEWLSYSSRYIFPILILIVFMSLFTLRRGYVRGAGIFLVIFIWLGLTYQASQSNGLRDVATISYLAIILLAGLLLGWREGLLTGIFSLAMLWYFGFQEQQGIYQFRMDPPLSFARDLTAVFIATGFLVYLLIHNLNRSLTDARLELKERLRVDEKLQIQTQYLTALHETALGLVNRLELNPLLVSILERVSVLLDTPHVGIDLLTPDESALRQELGKGIFLKQNGVTTQKGQGLVGKIWESGKTIYTQNYSQYSHKRDEAQDAGFGAVIGAPLKSGEKVLGVLVVAHMDKQKDFTSEQATLLERLAALASVAIDNARLYEKAQSEIVERRLVEKDLRSSEERFRKVFNNSNIAIAIVTLDNGIFLEGNNAFWQLSGLSPQAALGHSSLEFDLWKSSEDRDAFVQELLAKGSLQNVEVEFKNKDLPGKTSLAYYELISIKEQPCILCMFYDVTEQRQAERAFRESEERFRKVFHASPVAICITTLEEGILLDANDAYWNMSGYEPETSLGRSAEERELWDSMDDRREFVEKLRTNRSVFNPNYEFFDVLGNRRSVNAFYELIELNGQTCILSMFYDITEQKKAQDALQSAEARTRAILNAIPDMIFEVSKDGVFLDFMASAGLSPAMDTSRFIGKNILELFPSSIAKQTLFALERAIASGQLHAFEYGMPPGEETQFFEARVAAVTSESAIIMVRDISQRKWVETEREKLINELEDKNAESETLRESMAIIVETLDENKAVSLILEQLEKVIPYDSASVQLLRGNNDILEIVSTRRLEPPEEHIGLKFKVDENEPSYVLLTQQISYMLIEDVQKTNPIFHDASIHQQIRSWMAIPLRVKGQPIGIIALDGHRVGQFSKKDAELAVTYANQVAIALENARLFSELQTELAERKRLIEELENKNAELERFSYTVSHDLKSPLITIKGFLGFLEKDATTGNVARLRNDIQRIADATDKMQSLLNELLELSRVGRLVNPHQTISFNEIVNDALATVHGRLQENSVQVKVQENMPTVHGDRPRLFEIMQNLIDNAAKFVTPQTERLIEIGHDGYEDGNPVFFVRDNGIGIDPIHHDRIFGLFNKLDVDSDGTGVGLALVKRIIEVHKCRIWVQSEAGKGATFYFTLPAGPES